MAQVALLVAPTLALEVPGGQAVALTEEKGQKKPALQITGVPEAQKKAAGQATHCSWRMRRF